MRENEIPTREITSIYWPLRLAYGRELRVLLSEAVDRLPESLRTVFVLRCVEGMNVAEAADSLDLTPEAVRVRQRSCRSCATRVEPSPLRYGAGSHRSFSRSVSNSVSIFEVRSLMIAFCALTGSSSGTANETGAVHRFVPASAGENVTIC